MVFDTKTLDSFSALAGIIGEYTTPSQFTLSQDQQDQACRLRKEFGWHAQHIAEALGVGPAIVASKYTPKVLEALVGCTTRGGWGGAELDAKIPRPTLPEGALRDRLNLRGQAERDRLTSEEATVEGTNRFGELRKTARANAVVEAALAPEIRPFYDREGRKAGYKKNAVELAADADIIIRDQKRAGHYPGLDYRKLSDQSVLATIKDLVATGLFIWEGSGAVLGIREMPAEERAKVDAEILRQVREQAKLTPYRPPKGFYTRIEREIYRTFKCCGVDDSETMEGFGYSPFISGYASRRVGEVEPPIFSGPVGTSKTAQTAIDDPENIKAVKEAIGDSKELAPQIKDIREKTGLTRGVVEVILKNLGYMSGLDHAEAVRKIILPFHDNEKLTAAQMWDESAELRRLLTGETDPPKPKMVDGRPSGIDWFRRRGVARIRAFLLDTTPRRVPWTEATKRAERLAPKYASIIKTDIIAMVKAMENQRFFGERLLIRIPDISELSEALTQPESLVTEAMNMLLNEANPIIRREGQDIIVPNPIQRRIKSGEISRWEFSVN